MIADIRRRTVGTYTLGPVFEELDLILKGDFDALKKRRSKTPAAVSPQLPQQEPAATTIRVDLAKLDGLIGAAGELVLERNRLLNYIQTVEQGGSGDELAEELDEIGAHLNILVSELQSGIMSTRMQPVGKVFNRYPRIVRDLSRDLGKQIEVNISGAETELDNTIIEEIGDPLVHLVRNCCDHGIETPDERQRNGKSSAGHVDIRAYQEGNFVIIVISDDGKGMDPELLKHTAVSKGVITQEAASAMSDAEAFQLIFAPGFSTAEKVTAVSGRGVGMDVVKTNIGRLSGIIDLESKKGEGTTVRIRLPLTLAATVGIEIEVGEERYLVPQENIVEIIRISHHAYAMVLEQKRFLFRNQYWNPLVDLREILGVSLNGRVRAAHGYIIVLGQAERRVGVLVDNVLQQHEVVVRPLGQYVARFSPAHANGATVMGDGSVVLILNAAHLIAHGNRERVAV
jgi:two-component system chemotaxis sensor kinase CheA